MPVPEHDEHSQSTSGSITQQSGEASGSGSNEAATDDRVSMCGRLVDEAVENNWPATVLADILKDLGIRASEAADYIDELNQRIEIRRSKARRSGSPPHDPPADLPDHENMQEEQCKAFEEAAWASLRSKLTESAPTAISGSASSVLLDKVLELLSQESSSPSSLSKTVLAVAPHLAEDEGSIFDDPYLSETQKCKFAYASQKLFENLIFKAQGRKMQEPVANSIWKLVILDKYVDFEKLYAT